MINKLKEVLLDILIFATVIFFGVWPYVLFFWIYRFPEWLSHYLTFQHIALVTVLLLLKTSAEVATAYVIVAAIFVLGAWTFRG